MTGARDVKLCFSSNLAGIVANKIVLQRMFNPIQTGGRGGTFDATPI